MLNITKMRHMIMCTGSNRYGLSTGQLIPVRPEGKVRRHYDIIKIKI